MKNFFNNLNEREKWLVIIATACLLLYGYYLFLYVPLNQKVAQRSRLLAEQQSTLKWMEEVREQNVRSKKKLHIDNNKLLTVLATRLKDDPTLKFTYQLQQTAAGDIQLSFDAVPFNLFIAWLEKINKQYTINLKQLNAEQTNTPGVSRIMILLSAI